MSTVACINIADALVSLIAAATLPQAVTVERRWTAPLPREQIKAPLVLVVPIAVELDFETRGEYASDWQIALAIYAPASGTPATATVDALMELAEAIYLIARSNEALAEGRLIALNLEPMLDPEAIIGRGLFATIATLTYRSIAG
ncbi:MAG: hypothetical protein PSV22_00180 [Pseudolabrys sp.]|nr:hypothetical protein [Pseudolabrys sp.]